MNRRMLLKALPALAVPSVLPAAAEAEDEELVALAGRIDATHAEYQRVRVRPEDASAGADFERSWLASCEADRVYARACRAMHDALDARGLYGAVVSGRLYLDLASLSASSVPEEGDGPPMDLGIPVDLIGGL